MKMTTYLVPTHHIQQFWHLAAPHLQKAIDKGHGEFNIDQLKLVVAQGQQQLLIGLDEDQNCLAAVTVKWVMYPNDRVAYVTYSGGTQLKEFFNQFLSWIKNNGGTSVQCSTRYKSLIRLFERLNFKSKYTLMELKL